MRTTLVLFALLATALALPRIVINGNKFFNNATGEQFYVKGLDYAPSSDPLADIPGLTRDIPEFQKLGINTIRLYSSTAGDDHSEGLKMLDTASIYVVIDVTDEQYSIVSDNPTWNLNLFRNITNKMKPFFQAPNLLGFIAGNEVINSVNQTLAAPFVKAAIRDVKAFIKSSGYEYPVGYAGTDGQMYTLPLQHYLNCGSEDTSVDYYGLNTYRWCGDVTYETSGYPELTSEYQNYTRPFVFTEYGCNKVSPRPFTEVAAIYGDSRLSWLSGAFAYQYHNSTNNFGLVKIDSSTAVTEFQDFTNLADQLNKVDPSIAKLTDPAVTPALYNCPATSATNFLASTASLPPVLSESACQCMYNSLQCVVDVSSATPATIDASSTFACAAVSCAAVTTNSATGVYGQWSGCDDIQRASYIFNAYYQKNKNQGQSACSFKDTNNVSSGKVVTPSADLASCNSAGKTTTTTTTTSGDTTSPLNTSPFTTTSSPTTSGDVRPTGNNPSTTLQMVGSASGVAPVMITVLALVGIMMI